MSKREHDQTTAEPSPPPKKQRTAPSPQRHGVVDDAMDGLLGNMILPDMGDSLFEGGGQTCGAGDLEEGEMQDPEPKDTSPEHVFSLVTALFKKHGSKDPKLAELAVQKLKGLPIIEADKILEELLQKWNGSAEAMRYCDAQVLGACLQNTPSTIPRVDPDAPPCDWVPFVQNPQSDLHGVPVAVAGMLELLFKHRIIERADFLSRARGALLELPVSVFVQGLADFVARDRSTIRNPSGYLAAALCNLAKRKGEHFPASMCASVKRRLLEAQSQFRCMSSLSRDALSALAELSETNAHITLTLFFAAVRAKKTSANPSCLLEGLACYVRTVAPIDKAIKR